jgi:hypothetical protein
MIQPFVDAPSSSAERAKRVGMSSLRVLERQSAPAAGGRRAHGGGSGRDEGRGYRDSDCRDRSRRLRADGTARASPPWLRACGWRRTPTWSSSRTRSGGSARRSPGSTVCWSPAGGLMSRTEQGRSWTPEQRITYVQRAGCLRRGGRLRAHLQGVVWRPYMGDTDIFAGRAGSSGTPGRMTTRTSTACPTAAGRPQTWPLSSSRGRRSSAASRSTRTGSTSRRGRGHGTTCPRGTAGAAHPRQRGR